MRQRILSQRHPDALPALGRAVAIRFTARVPGAKRATPARHGFSLLEMIVVITIIAILLGVSTAMLAGMKQKAQAAVTRDTAKQLADAWTRHLQVLGEWPAEIEAASETKKFQADVAHLKTLNRMSGGKPGLGYYFLELNELELSEKPKDTNRSGLRDKWGDLFSLWFDTDYDGQIAHPYPPTGPQTVRTAVIVGSPGKDKKWGTKDDIFVY